MSKELEWLVSQEEHAAHAAVSSTVSPTTDVVEGEQKGIKTEHPDVIKGEAAKEAGVKVTLDGIDHGEPTEAKTLIDPDRDVNADGNKAGGKPAIGDASVGLEAHPNEPVAGGKMPEENKMDENPRGTVTHVDGTKEGVTVSTKDLDTPTTDEKNINADKDLDIEVGDKNVPTHVPGQTKVAQKQLDGSVDTLPLKTASVSIESLDPEADVVEGAAPVVAGEGEVAPVAPVVEGEGVVADPVESTEGESEGEGQSQLAMDISEITMDEVDPVEEAEAHVNEVADDIEQMEQMQTSLEAYHAILSQAMQRDGKIDPLLARTVSIGLENFGESWLTQAMPSLESFSDPTAQWTVSTEALDNLKKKSGELASGAKAALLKLWDWLVDLFNKVTSNTVALRDRNKIIEGLANSITTPNSKAMELKGARRLYANDLFVGDSPAGLQSIKKAGENFLVTYPRTVEKVLNQFKTNVKKLNHLTHSGDDVMRIGQAAYDDNFKFEAFGLKPVTGNAIPATFSKFNAVGRSEILAGNKAMYAGLKTATSTGANGSSFNANQTAFLNPELFKMGFLDVTDAKSGEPDAQLKVPAPNVIKVMIKSVDDLISTLDDIKGAQASLSKTKETLDRDVFAIYSVGEYFKSEMGQAAVGMANILGRNAMVPVGNYIGYLVGMIKAFQALLTAYVEHHGGKAEVVKDDSVIEGQVA